MPARAWILIFALAGGSISLAIAVAGVVGSTEWDSATLADELEANSKTGKWLTRNRRPYASDGSEDV